MRTKLYTGLLSLAMAAGITIGMAGTPTLASAEPAEAELCQGGSAGISIPDSHSW